MLLYGYVCCVAAAHSVESNAAESRGMVPRSHGLLRRLGLLCGSHTVAAVYAGRAGI